MVDFYRFSLVFAVFGLIVLYSSLLFSPSEVNSIEGLNENSRVILRGLVSNESLGTNYNILVIKGVVIHCNCESGYLNKQVELEGYVDSFNNKSFVVAQSLRVIE